ncbi:hypothetical protein STCU_10351 [Strigomonas culicis]|uniref:Uncharacterized protein n=1 Tax=Strigomonas culicis TaxID=28005 RepID=S9TM61_9TRYP|nr:hypothetical protein STCU_10351 [Strigomonas culicis]|eukprot:EPY17879.1 hypothetical protein STCU_10351 [Strigomonas culicis]
MVQEIMFKKRDSFLAHLSLNTPLYAAAKFVQEAVQQRVGWVKVEFLDVYIEHTLFGMAFNCFAHVVTRMIHAKCTGVQICIDEQFPAVGKDGEVKATFE